MLHSLRKISGVAILACAVALASGVVSGEAPAGQRRAQSPIPGRLMKVKEGDWILTRTSEGLIKETATKIEVTEADPENNIEPFYMVLYTLEKFDPATGRPLEKPLDVGRDLETEADENLANVEGMVARPQRRKVKIGGRDINVIVIRKQEEGGVNVEEWFSDEVGIDGRVAIVFSGEEIEPYTALEALAFGDARTPLDINRYLSRK